MPRKSAETAVKTESAGPSRSAVALSVRRGIFQPSTLWWLACGLLILVFLPYIPWLIPNLSQQADYRVGWDRVHVSPAPPERAPAEFLKLVREQAKLPEELPLLDRGLAKKLARAFGAYPWVADVKRVEVTRQRTVEVQLEYRHVSLLVETSRGFYPVDVKGVLLPPADFTTQEVARLPIVRNIKTMPQGNVGERWGDTVVECAARLAEALAPEGDVDPNWKRLGLEAIVAPTPKVANPDAEDLRFQILTKGQSVVLWGRSPGADSLEPTVEEKLARLAQVVRSQGSLDGPGGPYRIDICHDVIALHPLSARR
jgi:hypothetical protein